MKEARIAQDDIDKQEARVGELIVGEHSSHVLKVDMPAHLSDNAFKLLGVGSTDNKPTGSIDDLSKNFILTQTTFTSHSNLGGTNTKHRHG